MTGPVRFAYVQARLQASHGRLPDAASWQSIEASQTLDHYLSLAHAGPLAVWTKGLKPTPDVQDIEQHLRTRWRRRVDDIARWLPPAWQPAVREFGALTQLASADDPAGRASRWLADWQTLWPSHAGHRAALGRPAELLLPRLAGSAQGRGATAERERAALVLLFRRHAGTAVAVFAHLALLALDVERLRGGAVRRRLFPRAAAARSR